MTETIGTALYLALLGLLLPFGLHRLYLLWLRFRPDGATDDPEGATNDPVDAARRFPRVTVQLPVYNEASVVERAIDAACRLDVPRDRLEVQVLDDSTDETSRLAAARVRTWRRRGIDARHIRRESREGYKAGALAEGVRRARGELFLVLDADFVPRPDLVRRLLPSFGDPEVGFVQAAWGHLNRDERWLTRAQAVLLDAHFAVEHGARHRADLFFNFNGTAGMWRREALADAGGWQADTLTEDLDLSYRAQLRGWRGVYRDDVEVPAELPDTLRALEVQQRRWTRGGLETARKLLPSIWRSDERPAVKLEATAHLLGHLAHPITLLLGVALAWPDRLAATLAAIPAWAHAGAAVLVLTPFLLYFGAAVLLRGGRAATAPLRVLEAVALGIGLGPALVGPVASGLVGSGGTFRRTPKRGDGAATSLPLAYRLPGRPLRDSVRGFLAVLLVIAGGSLAGAGHLAGAFFTLLFGAGYGATSVLGFAGALAQATEPVAGQQGQDRPVDGEGETGGLRPRPGGAEGVQARVAQEDRAAQEDPGRTPAQAGEGEDPQHVPGVERGRQQQARPECRVQGEGRRPAPQDGQAHQRGQQPAEERSEGEGASEEGVQEPVDPPVEGPSPRVLAEAAEEGGSGLGVG